MLEQRTLNLIRLILLNGAMHTKPVFLEEMLKVKEVEQHVSRLSLTARFMHCEYKGISRN